MKKLSLAMLLLFTGLSSLFCQYFNDTIKTEKVFGGYQYYQYENRLSMNELVDLLEEDYEAHTQLKAARLNYQLSNMLGFVGAIMVGYPLGTAIAGGNAQWVLAGIGAGLVIVSIPVSGLASRQAKTAIETFNRYLKESHGQNPPELFIELKPGSFGIVFHF